MPKKKIKVVEPEIVCIPDKGVYVTYPDGTSRNFRLTHYGFKVVIEEKNAWN